MKRQVFLTGLMGASMAFAQTGRLLAPGDWIRIRCPESARFCVTRELDPWGNVRLPGLPPIKLQGLRIDEAESAMAQRLERSGTLTGAQIRVLPLEGKRLTVSVGGLVKRPEVRYLSPGLTIQELVNEAVLQPEADPTRVAIVDVYGTTRTVDGASFATVLRPGDEVQVLPRVARPEVFVIGGVEIPGPVPFESGLTVAQAVTRAGGVSALGRSGRWRLGHPNGAYVTLADTPDATGTPLQPGDTLEVPFTDPVEAIFIVGAVKQPSRVDFRKGTRLSAVVKAAGGLRPGARTNSVTIRSLDGGVVSADPGNPAQDRILKPGDWILVPSG